MSKLFIRAGSRLRTGIFCAGFLLSATAFGADNYTQWTYSSAIILNTTAAGINGPVTNFPIVLKLTAANFSGFGQAKADGSDIRFSTSTGTHLPYQIERWDQAGQLAEIWVRVDQIQNNNGSQYIKMYWGNAAAVDSQRSVAVFDTANGFQAVWHLGEAGAGNTSDATVNNFTGTANGATKPAETMGIIGRGKSFDGTASSFEIANSATSKLNFPQGGPYTISAWVNTNVLDGFYHDILTKGDHQYNMAVSASNNWQVTEFQNNVGWMNSGFAASTGIWRYMVGIRNGTAISLYLDGVHIADSTGGFASAIPRVTTFNVAIGGNLDTAGYGTGGNGKHLFNGRIDELSLANKARSADWIKLSFENQKPNGIPNGVLTYGPRNLTYPTNPASYVAGTAITTNTPTYAGGAPTSYSVAPGLPGGLTLNTSTGQITGTPTAGVGVATANYVVTASNIGGSATVSLSITVLGPPTNLTYSTNPATYVTGTAITANSPTSSGGAVVSYSVTPSLPSGLALNASTGVITGIPAVVAAATPYTVTATNAAGSTTASLSITVNAALLPPAGLTYSTNPASYVTGTAIATNTPTSSGGAVASYSVSPTLPAGLALSPSTGLITGTPTAVQTATPYTVTATNAAGSTTVSLSIRVTAALAAPSSLYYSTNPASYVTGTAIVTNTPTSSGGAVASYSVSPTLPAGLALSPSTGLITGTPTVVQAASPYTVTATNAAGSTTVSLSITVTAALVAPSSLTYSTNPASYVTGTAIATNTPTSSGGAVASYSVSPTLPAGLALSPSTGLITGTPTAAQAATPYTVTATNAAGSTTASLSITVNAALLPPAGLTYSTNPASYVTGTAIATNTPTSSGGAVASYSVSPTLPAGLALSPSTGLITGTPTAAQAATPYTVTATNAAGSTTVSLSITVTAALVAPSSLTYSTNPASYVTGTAIATNTPTSSGGAVASYSVSPTLPVGLALSPSSGLITGTPTAVQAATPYTVTATNAAGSTTVALSITVTAALVAPSSLTYSTNPASYVTGTAIATNTPTSSGGAVASYSVSPTLPAGLALSPSTGLITGTPTAVKAATPYTVTATNAAGSTTVSLSITITSSVIDTLTPANNLVLSGTYDTAWKDTARLYVGSISSIDTNKVDSMFVWYSLTKTDTANFKDNAFARGVSVSDVTKATVNNQYAFSIENKSFLVMRDTIYCAVMVKGKNDRPSPVKNYQFPAGIERPVNPITLHARVLSATRVQLSWNNVSKAGIDRIAIWYRAGTPVDTAIFDQSAQNLNVLSPAVTDTVIVGNNFNAETMYYFGAQVFKGAVGSKITTNASTRDSTPEAGAKLDSNTVHLVKPIVFDTSTNTIKIGWTVNRVVSDSLDIGISYSTAAMPVADTSVGQWIPVTGNAGNAVLKLHEDLAFNTTYHVAVWLRRPGGAWTEPTQSSSDTVTTPSFTWQSVLYFTKQKDLVYAFNRELRLTNDSSDVSTTPNQIVRYITVPPAGGFTQVSIGVEFTVKDRGNRFYIGLKIDSIPAGSTISNVRIYRDSAGILFLSREPYDAANGYISVYTNNLDFPFVAMVDNAPPAHTTLSHPEAAVVAAKSVSDTIEVRDNIANVKWKFMAGRGDKPYDTISTGMLHTTAETLIVTIDSVFVSQDNGVRALLITTDGVHSDTVALSRSVLRDGLDIAFTEEQKWVPLSVSAVLDTPDMKTVLRELSPDATNWTYDNTRFRIFRCFPDPGMTNPWKWVEYADTIHQEFDFVRGNVMWAKTSKQRTVRYGPGRTPSLDSSFVVRIEPKAWTDIAMPFNFGITVGDILDASGKPGFAGESLEFYSWVQDLKNHSYSLQLVFLKSKIDPLVNDPTTQLSAAITVYNPTQDTMQLSVPPIPVALSRQGLHKKSTAQGFAVRIAASGEDGSTLSSVYCGYSPEKSGGTSYYPQAPSFGSAHVGVFDDNAKKVYGHAMAHVMKNGGFAYLLAFVNDAAVSQRISYRLENLGTVPKGMRAAVYDAASGKLADFSSADAGVSVAAASREYRWLLVGDAGYLAKPKMIARPAVLSLVGTYPNPFRNMVRIRYSLPYEGVKNVRFTIYNLTGKVVWRHEIKDVSTYGACDLVWKGTSGADNRPAAAGIYILHMSALNSSFKPVGVFERKMTLLP